MSILFQPYDWDNRDDLDKTECLEIYCWALDKKSQPLLIRIYDFPIWCYIKLPDKIDNQNVVWNKSKVNTIVEKINNILKDNASISHSISKKFTLYYYQEKKSSFIKIFFNSNNAINHCKNVLKKGLYITDFSTKKIIFEVLESDISPVRKFISYKKLTYTQWCKIDESFLITDECEKISHLEKEYYVSYTDFLAATEDEYENLFTVPKISVFDIETFSENPNSFPDANNENDVSYMISVINEQFNIIERERICILYGNCNDISEEKLKNCKIIRVNSEKDMIDEFITQLNLFDPDLVSGYNIFGFDYKYLNIRLKRNCEKWLSASRLKGDKSDVPKPKEWESKAYGKNANYILKMNGRINFDLMISVKRLIKLRNYKLNTVANKYLNVGKDEISAKEMFRIYRELKEDENKRTLDAMTTVVEYCIKDSELVLDLFNKLNMWFSLIATSNVCGIKIQDIDTRGQQIRVYSQLYDLAYHDGYVINKIENNDADGFEGGFVSDPVVGAHDGVIVLDFNSMYPNKMLELNLCYTTLIKEDETYEDCHETKFIQEEKTIDDKKIKIEKEYCYNWINKSKREGLLPKLIKKLLSARKNVKNKMKFAIGILKEILNEQQAALKVSANSVYGFTGASESGILPCKPISRATTAGGRSDIKESIIKCQKIVPTIKQIYGDTDSIMFTLGINIDHFSDEEKIKEYFRIADKIVIELNSQYAENVKLELEKIIFGIFIKKKKYIYLEYNRDGTLIEELKQKGVITARREACEWTKEVFNKIVLNKLYYEVSLKDTVEYIFEQINNLLNGRIPLKKLSFAQKMGSDYKSKSYFMGVFARKLQRQKNLVSIGERLEYVIIDNNKKIEEQKERIKNKCIINGDEEDLKLIGNKMELLEYYEKSDNKEPLDYKLYLEKKFKDPISQILSIAYKDEIDNINFTYKPTNRHKEVGFEKLIDIILKFIKYEPEVDYEDVISSYLN